MSSKIKKIAIINRSFWPENPAIGEALLLLSESLSDQSKPIVITQVGKDFFKQLKEHGRGEDVKFVTLPSMTDSSSAMILRVLELLLFTGFTLSNLIYYQPDKVYIATNPPIFTPLAVRWYCQIFGKDYIYHVQDIHPEITTVLTGKKNFITNLISLIDIKNTIKASTVITLTDQMRLYLNKRANTTLPITLLSNPSVQGKELNHVPLSERIKGFVYCGNAGRLQRIPLLIEAISDYTKKGGSLPFVFAGGGIYSKEIQKLADQFQNVTYLGVLPADKAADLLSKYTFGLLPIENEVTKLAFPSKSSSYVFSGCKIVAVCGRDTSIADWVFDNDLGYVCKPDVNELVSSFHELEEEPITELSIKNDIFKRLTPKYHADFLKKVIMSN